MITSSVLKKVKHQKIGNLALVVLPLAQWQEVEAIIEDYEMMRSGAYRDSIAESRKQIRQRKSQRLDLKTGKFEKAQKP